MATKIKMRVLARSVLNGVLGIAAELLLIALVIVIGFLVCAVWWRVFIR